MSQAVRTKCPKCSAQFRLKSASSFGKTIKCRKCGRPFRARPVDDDIEQDEFDDDFGQADEERDLPRATAQSRSKSKKKRRKSKPIGWKLPVALVTGAAILLTVAGVGYQLTTGGSFSDLATAFDSHERLIKDRMGIYRQVESLLASLETKEDVESAKSDMISIGVQSARFDQRMLLLGEIEPARAKELTRMWKDREEERKAAEDRIEAHIDRLKGVLDLSFVVHVELLHGLRPDYDLVTKLAKPDAQHPRTADLRQFEYDCVRQLRKANLIVVQMTNANSAAKYVAELNAVNDEIRSLADRRSKTRKLGPTVDVHSPYWKQYNAAVSFMRDSRDSAERIKQWSADNPKGAEAIKGLSIAVRTLEFSGTGMGMSRSQNNQSNPGNSPFAGRHAGTMPPNSAAGGARNSGQPAALPPGNGFSSTAPGKKLTAADFKAKQEASTNRFIKSAGGPAKVVTLTFVNGDAVKTRKFANEMSAKKLTKFRSMTSKKHIIGWEGSPQSLADKIDFAEIVSVDDEKRTLQVKLPE